MSLGTSRLQEGLDTSVHAAAEIVMALNGLPLLWGVDVGDPAQPLLPSYSALDANGFAHVHYLMADGDAEALAQLLAADAARYRESPTAMVAKKCVFHILSSTHSSS